jgi:hypothetical protein
MLRPRALRLPENGWGLIEVNGADIDFDVTGDPKTGDRRVPIPANLVALLRAWLDVLHARVPLAEAARRLGHSVETLVSTYVGALNGDEIAANQMIDEYLRSWRPPDPPTGEQQQTDPR